MDIRKISISKGGGGVSEECWHERIGSSLPGVRTRISLKAACSCCPQSWRPQRLDDLKSLKEHLTCSAVYGAGGGERQHCKRDFSTFKNRIYRFGDFSFLVTKQFTRANRHLIRIINDGLVYWFLMETSISSIWIKYWGIDHLMAHSYIWSDTNSASEKKFD